MNKKWDGVERRNTAQLRETAEAMLANIMPAQVQKRPVEELLHELQIHHVELEMQAEQLRSAQIALEESRDRYVSLYDFAPVGYLTLTDAGLIAEVNLTGAALLEMERKKLLQCRFTKFVAPEDRDRWHQHFSLALQQSGKQNGELALVRADGTVFHARLDCLHMTEDGKAGMTRIAFTDVTERKRIETMLRESEEKLRGIFEGTLDGIVLADLETKRFNTCNPAFCRMLGYSPEEIARLSVSDIHPQQDLPRVIEQFENLLRGELNIAADIPVKRKDGSVFYVDIKSARVHLGGKLYLVGVFRDITERKQAEEIRRISALKYQLLFESSRDALMTLAPPLWKFTGANKATLELFGASSVAEFVASGPWEVSPERQPDGLTSSEKVQETIAAAMREGSCFFEWEHQRLDGRPFTADVLLTRMKLGDDVFLQATVRDITERKRLENELEESRQLLRDLADKAEILREEERKSIAREVHDELGQILTALRMDVALINLCFGEHNAALLEKTQGMSSLLDQAGRSVRNIVSNLRPTALDAGIVAAVGWLCDEFAAHTGSPCVLNTNEEHIDLEEGRAVAVFRIVQELLTNVARHAEASRAQITLTRHAGNLHVEVRDNGKGFDSAAMAKNKSFGLLGVHERAIAMGGGIEVVSVPQLGTAVTIRMPTKSNGGSK